jgi:hypothetical protein
MPAVGTFIRTAARAAPAWRAGLAGTVSQRNLAVIRSLARLNFKSSLARQMLTYSAFDFNSRSYARIRVSSPRCWHYYDPYRLIERRRHSKSAS